MILCADDFGMAPAVNRGILELAQHGRVSAVACMVTEPRRPADAAALGQHRDRIDLGLHLVLTNDPPCSSLPRDSGLNGTRGGLPAFGELVRRGLLGQLEPGALRGELVAQLDRFAALFGGDPDFIDGHQHVHQLAPVRSVLVPLLLERGFRGHVRSGTQLSIGMLGGRMKSLLTNHGLRTNRRLWGWYRHRGPGSFERLFARVLAQQPARDDLLYCHPGVVDDALRARDVLLAAREDTLAFLQSARCTDLMAAHGVEINRFGS